MQSPAVRLVGVQFVQDTACVPRIRTHSPRCLSYVRNALLPYVVGWAVPCKVSRDHPWVARLARTRGLPHENFMSSSRIFSHENLVRIS